MFDFLKNSNFNEYRNNKKHYIFRSLDLTNPTWNEILNHLNRNITSKAQMKVLGNLGFVFFDAEKMKSVDLLLSEIKKLTDRPCSAHCYISLLEISNTFGRHKDNSDVFFWQVQGSTRWRVEEDAKIFEYNLSVNDIIYIPRFTMHEVVPLGPRAGISFGIDYD